MSWTAELDAVLKIARSTNAEDLPRFLGDLETVRAVAWQRLSTPTPRVQQSTEEMVDVHEAARRLGVSTKYLYTNQSRFHFTRHLGRRVLFSATDLNAYIRRNGAKAPLRHQQHGGIVTGGDVS
jgi:excisionase family DNA binding protein